MRQSRIFFATSRAQECFFRICKFKRVQVPGLLPASEHGCPCGLARAAGSGRTWANIVGSCFGPALPPRARKRRGDSVGSGRARGTTAGVCVSQSCGRPRPSGSSRATGLTKVALLPRAVGRAFQGSACHTSQVHRGRTYCGPVKQR